MVFGYVQGIPILNQINFDVEVNKTLAIVGASGCGKSTFLRILSGILPKEQHFYEGQILIDDLAIDKWSEYRLGFMFQDPSLLPNLNVTENIGLPLSIKGVLRENGPRIDELIQMVGLQKEKEFLPKHLSGGMKTRVALARTFTTSPKMLLLDEPFGALDVGWKMKLYRELDLLQNKFGPKVILVTHDIREAITLADQIIVFGKKGSVIGKFQIIKKHSILENAEEFKEWEKTYFDIQTLIVSEEM